MGFSVGCGDTAGVVKRPRARARVRRTAAAISTTSATPPTTAPTMAPVGVELLDESVVDPLETLRPDVDDGSLEADVTNAAAVSATHGAILRQGSVTRKGEREKKLRDASSENSRTHQRRLSRCGGPAVPPSPLARQRQCRQTRCWRQHAHTTAGSGRPCRPAHQTHRSCNVSGKNTQASMCSNNGKAQATDEGGGEGEGK